MKKILLWIATASLAVGVIGCKQEKSDSMDLMKTNGGSSISSSTTTKPAVAKVYTCTMHPEIVTDKPGKCPKCGMDLVVKQ